MDNLSVIYGSSWYAATKNKAPCRPALAQDMDVDVCVIGGGLAGLTTAYELAKRGKSVVLLEKRRLAWNASGRNAGFVSPGFAESPEPVIKRVGVDHARELWALSQRGVDYVRNIIDEHELPGVALKNGRLTVQRINDEAGMARHATLLRDTLKTDAEAWATERVRDVLISRRYFQAVYLPGAFHMHSLNYALGLTALAEKAGVRIFEMTPALFVDTDKTQKIIFTSQAKIRAAHIVYACSSHIGALNAKLRRAILPVSTYVAVTTPLGKKLETAIRTGCCVADTRRAGDYYRIVGGDRLLWGGRITTRLSTPHKLAQMMRADILRVYPQLEPVEIDYVWPGLMGYALHKMPQIGQFAPQQWVASAFGGHGLNTTAMAGELIAQAIAENDSRWKLFLPFGLQFAGGVFGRVGVQLSYWSMQARDYAEETMSPS